MKSSYFEMVIKREVFNAHFWRYEWPILSLTTILILILITLIASSINLMFFISLGIFLSAGSYLSNMEKRRYESMIDISFQKNYLGFNKIGETISDSDIELNNEEN